MRYFLLSIAIMLSGCKNVTVNVPMDNVKLADGYYNSSTLSLGDMYIWDTKGGSIELIYTFSNKDLSVPTKGDEYDQKRSSISANTDMSVSGNMDALKALPKVSGSANDSNSGQLGAGFRLDVASLSNVTVKSFRRVVWGNSLGLLNRAKLAWLRKQWAATYPEDYWKYVFVYQIINGKDISISAKRTTNFDASANVYTYGEYKAKLTYGREYSQDLTASKDAPLIVDMHVFRLDPSGTFRPDPTQLNFQTVARNRH